MCARARCLYLYYTLFPARCSYEFALVVRTSYAARTLLVRCSRVVRTNSLRGSRVVRTLLVRARTHPRTTRRARLCGVTCGGVWCVAPFLYTTHTHTQHTHTPILTPENFPPINEYLAVGRWVPLAVDVGRLKFIEQKQKQLTQGLKATPPPTFEPSRPAKPSPGASRRG